MMNPLLDKVSKDKTPIMMPGPYLAKVVSFIDSEYMGTLQVQLLKTTTTGNPNFAGGSMYQAKYLSPFTGQTPRNGVTANDGYRDSQQAYGMWMIPPDIGTQVLIIFAEGNPNMCYWLGCVQDRYMNFSVPGNAATSFTKKVDADGNDLIDEKMKPAKLPVSEYNKVTETGLAQDPTKFEKPHQKEFVNGLVDSGLIFDETRGITTSSARREVPSAVFGFNTPGPIDKRPGAPKSRIGTNEEFVDVYKSRLGGTSLVADDGDDKFLRKTTADKGPPEYADVMQNETDGKRELPHNELFRVRTRTGHQILLHNTEDLIYIANARGTAWLEMTSDGKIDIYAEDSISMYSGNDFNFTANRNVTIEAGANLYLKASDNHNASSKKGGKIQIESAADTNILIGANGKITTSTNFDLNTGSANKFTAGTTTDILSGGNHTETAPKIDMNGPTAATAEQVSPLNTHINPGPSALGWLTQRMPQHEPWPWHENLNPQAFKPVATDRDNNFTTKNDEPTPSIPDTFKKTSKANE
jgi:hypothetical protein